MKSYKDYEKVSIGYSDISALILAGLMHDGTLMTDALYFGEDGSYNAYLVDENAEIGEHYKLVKIFHHWLRIYDDEEMAREINGGEIRIYRAGEFGCIIQVINE